MHLRYILAAPAVSQIAEAVCTRERSVPARKGYMHKSSLALDCQEGWEFQPQFSESLGSQRRYCASSLISKKPMPVHPITCLASVSSGAYTGPTSKAMDPAWLKKAPP